MAWTSAGTTLRGAGGGFSFEAAGSDPPADGFSDSAAPRLGTVIQRRPRMTTFFWLVLTLISCVRPSRSSSPGSTPSR